MPYKRTGSLDGIKPWDARATRLLAQQVRAVVLARAFDRGHGLKDDPHKPYSSKPIHMPIDTFPKPRGGQRSSKKPRGGAQTLSRASGSVYYEGGYREYKENTQGSSRVNLTQSGAMRRSFRVKKTTKTQAWIGLTGAPTVYGLKVNQERPWLGLSPADKRLIKAATQLLIKQTISWTKGGR